MSQNAATILNERSSLQGTYILHKISDTQTTDRFLARSTVTSSNEVDLIYLKWEKAKRQFKKQQHTILTCPAHNLNNIKNREIIAN